MRLLTQPARVTTWSRQLHREGVTIGFVPTMGALHEGHRALIRAARLACDAVIVSIFVNPTQFGPREDLTHYPRTLARDTRLCREDGVDVVFAPSVTSMYPTGFQTEVHVPLLAARWEGAVRPHHFAGMSTIVTKLLSIVQPDVTYFGQKDFQQAAVVQRLVADLNLPSMIAVHPTIRESDGLALSSRNAFLTPVQRQRASRLFEALTAGAQLIRRGTRSGPAVVRAMQRLCRAQRGIRVDYLAACDPDTLEPLSRIPDTVVLLGALRLGSVRLLDNLIVRRLRS